jgi:type I restriction enzyme S subunit
MTARSDWHQTTLGAALPIRYGKARTDKAGVVREESPVYGSSGVIGKFDRALTAGPALIIGRKGTVGATHYSAQPCWPIDTVYFAEATHDKDLRFFKYLLDHLQLGRMDRSTAVPGLSRDDYNAKEVAIPDIDEQQRVVAEIEKQFTRLDAGVASLKRVQCALKRYRASVLKAACEGNFAHEPISVAIAALDQGWSPKCENAPSASEDIWAVIKTSAIQPLRFIQAENKRLPAPLRPRSHLELEASDLLITRAGPRSRAGVTCLVRSTRPRLMLCDKAYRIKTKREVGDPAFLEIVLNAPHIVDAIDHLKTGISDSGVNLTQKRFSELVIPLPSIAEQQRIVAEVERRLSLIEELETAAAANVFRAIRLRQSILQRAFTPRISEDQSRS